MSNDDQSKQTALPKPEIPAGPLINQLYGMPEARDWAEGLAKDVELCRAGTLLWNEIESGCILYGPPGTGKTTLALAVAATARIPLIAAPYAEWVRGGRYGNDVIRRMGATFELARMHAPCVVAIDELDSLPNRAGLSDEFTVSVMIVNALLGHLDGLSERQGIIVIGTCNHLHRLDPAVIRPGRLGRHIEVPLPGPDALPHILRYHLRPDATGLADLESIAAMCEGMSGAEIEQLVQDARRRARRCGQTLATSHLQTALLTRCATSDPETRRRLAIYEAARAVATRRLKTAARISPSLHRHARPPAAFPGPNRPLTRRMIIQEIAILLAGRAAEQQLLGEVSTRSGGASDSDLARATQFAAACTDSYGLSENPVLFWLAQPGHMVRYPCPEALTLISDAYAAALQLISQETAFVEAVAKALMDKHALSHEAFAALDPGNRQRFGWYPKARPRPVSLDNSSGQIDPSLVQSLKRLAGIADDQPLIPPNRARR